MGRFIKLNLDRNVGVFVFQPYLKSKPGGMPGAPSGASENELIYEQAKQIWVKLF